MAVYKVPQDVEAEDKLLGPLTFRQFIYLIIAVVSAIVAFFMAQIFLPLLLIPLPITFLFGVLALPLRKDQPMETYLLALLRFYLKPKNRLWDPDGTITYVEITAPHAIEQKLAKEYSGEAAKERLDYLARVMDSRGWSLKGVNEDDQKISDDVVAEAQSAVDVLDEDAALSQSINTLIAKKDQELRKEAIASMQQPQTSPTNTPQSVWSSSEQPPASAIPPSADEPTNLHYNPYPTSIHQKVIAPIDEQEKQHKATKSKKVQSSGSKPAMQPEVPPSAQSPQQAVPPSVSPDIIRLATTSKGLSISAIAHEAHRLEGKLEDDEVVIKLH